MQVPQGNPLLLSHTLQELLARDTVQVELIPQKKGLFLKHVEYEVSSQVTGKLCVCWVGRGQVWGRDGVRRAKGLQRVGVLGLKGRPRTGCQRAKLPGIHFHGVCVSLRLAAAKPRPLAQPRPQLAQPRPLAQPSFPSLGSGTLLLSTRIRVGSLQSQTQDGPAWCSLQYWICQRIRMWPPPTWTLNSKSSLLGRLGRV